ncbi:Dimethyladenosine transferase [Tieghemostelium lacteum]|uniref:rRNA adenine N(6)-methyltransferase n=1 Tax=Tieghemostelium lacteum TaxID=361077 RepID=A0A151Z360_TIELA|nr:Dimethyladenosine transferase [Tieghemostelium lacteum]|eukprot:KYQ88390.1 Dimethyladenosine transferase [Tieghemostelium lacteum]
MVGKLVLPPMPKIQELIRLYGLSAKQQLSQNFLLDLNVTNKICKLSGGFKDCTVIEVGAGPGGLTRSLLTSDAKKIIAVEMDNRFYPALKMLEEASQGKLTIVMGNMMEVDEAKILYDNGAEKSDWSDDKSKVAIIGNLPFNVGTHLMLKWVRQIQPRKGLYEFGRVPMYLMFQKELAERVVAGPGTADYSRLSVMVQHQCHTKILYDLPGKCFVPPPKVDASVIKVEPRLEPLGGVAQSSEYFEYVARELFTQKRKLLSNAAELLSSEPEYAHQLIEGFDPKQRVANLTIPQFVDITNRFVDFSHKKSNIDLLEFKTEGKNIRIGQSIEKQIDSMSKRVDNLIKKDQTQQQDQHKQQKQQTKKKHLKKQKEEDDNLEDDFEHVNNKRKSKSIIVKKVSQDLDASANEMKNKKEDVVEEDIDENLELLRAQERLENLKNKKQLLLKRQQKTTKFTSGDDEYDSFLNDNNKT